MNLAQSSSTGQPYIDGQIEIYKNELNKLKEKRQALIDQFKATCTSSNGYAADPSGFNVALNIIDREIQTAAVNLDWMTTVNSVKLNEASQEGLNDSQAQKTVQGFYVAIPRTNRPCYARTPVVTSSACPYLSSSNNNEKTCRPSDWMPRLTSEFDEFDSQPEALRDNFIRTLRAVDRFDQIQKVWSQSDEDQTHAIKMRLIELIGWTTCGMRWRTHENQSKFEAFEEITKANPERYSVTTSGRSNTDSASCAAFWSNTDKSTPSGQDTRVPQSGQESCVSPSGQGFPFSFGTVSSSGRVTPSGQDSRVTPSGQDHPSVFGNGSPSIRAHLPTFPTLTDEVYYICLQRRQCLNSWLAYKILFGAYPTAKQRELLSNLAEQVGYFTYQLVSSPEGFKLYSTSFAVQSDRIFPGFTITQGGNKYCL